MKQIALSWEKRSRLWRDNRRAVMEQSFPDVLNRYLEEIHLSWLLKHLPNRGEKIICLDVGCGYGRVAQIIAKRRSKAIIHGVDVSPTFVSLYNRNLKKRGKAVVGSMTALPYKDNHFDVVWIIVSLMYAEKKADQLKTIKELFRVTKPAGKVIIIEPNSLGVNIVRLWGFIPYVYRIVLGKKKVETFGISFPWKRIDTIVKESGGLLLQKRGYPLLTILILPLLILGRFFSILSTEKFGFITFFDRLFPIARFSYFIAYTAQKKK